VYLCGGRRRGVLGVEQFSPFQQDASNAEHPVGDAAQGTAVGMAACAQRFVPTLAFRIFLHRDTGPMEHGLTQPGMGSVAHDNDAGLATAPGDRLHPGQGPERIIVPAAERPGRFGQQGGEVRFADARQRSENGSIARRGRACRLCLGQCSAQIVDFVVGLAELSVRKAEPGDKGTQVRDGRFRDARGHRESPRPQDAKRGFSTDLADAMLLEQTSQGCLAQTRGFRWRRCTTRIMIVVRLSETFSGGFGRVEAAMDCGGVDVEGPGDLTDGLAFLNQREGKRLLIRTKFLRSAERHAAMLGGLASLVGAMPDQGALELSNAGEHGQHHASGGCGRIRPRFLERL